MLTGKKMSDHSLVVDLAANVLPIGLQGARKALQGTAPEIPGLAQVYKAGIGTAHPYRTEAQKLASKLASDRSEGGMIAPEMIAKHRAKLEYEDQVRSGSLSTDDIRNDIIEGKIAPEEAKQILKQAALTKEMGPATGRLYTRAAHLPLPDFLQVWDVATESEQKALKILKLQKTKAYVKNVMKSMTPDERKGDPTLARILQDPDFRNISIF